MTTTPMSDRATLLPDYPGDLQQRAHTLGMAVSVGVAPDGQPEQRLRAGGELLAAGTPQVIGAYLDGWLRARHPAA